MIFLLAGQSFLFEVVRILSKGQNYLLTGSNFLIKVSSYLFYLSEFYV